MALRKHHTGYAAIVVVFAIIAGLAWGSGLNAHIAARKHFYELSKADAEAQADKMQNAFGALYDYLRTIALLPGVRSIDRRGETLSEETRVTLQQIFDTLASRVRVSEIHITTIEFDPERRETDTSRFETPAISLDNDTDGGVTAASLAESLRPSIADWPDMDVQFDKAGNPRLEIYEFRQIRSQLDILAQTAPAEAPDDKPPLASSPEVVTSDNSLFDHSHDEADRRGLVFSVPFYGANGALRGVVSATVLSKSLAGLLPNRNFALVNPSTGYISEPSADGQERLSAQQAARALPDPSLIFSWVETIHTADAERPWFIWAGRPDADFSDSEETIRLSRASLGNELAIILLGVSALLGYHLYLQAHRAARRAEESERRQSQLARTDPLTGLFNRFGLNERFPTLLTQARVLGVELAVVAIDLDSFKTLNDLCGHEAGDHALIAVAKALLNAFPDAFVARVGGDEFIMLTLVRHGDDVDSKAQAAVRAIDASANAEIDAVKIGCSIGYAVAPQDGETRDELLRHADQALYRAKADGRGVVRPYDASLKAANLRRRAVENALEQALSHGRITAAYQPVVDAISGVIVAVEALARWEDDYLGPISPAEFIPIAEARGWIADLGEQVLTRAMRDGRNWPQVSISVNLSAQHFLRADVARIVGARLTEADFPAARLEIEITESLLITDEARVKAQLAALRDLGVAIALDDFGAGYANLQYLRQFPFDRVKIDRDLVRNCVDSAAARSLIAALVSMSQAVGVAVTAEGVEDAAQARLLTEIGCQQLQGYLFWRPLAAAELEPLILGQHRSDLADAS